MDYNIEHLESLKKQVKELGRSAKNFEKVETLFDLERTSEDIRVGTYSYHNHLFQTNWKAKEPFENVLNKYKSTKKIYEAYQEFISEFIKDINMAISYCKKESDTPKKN